jgi:phenylacetate-CoA ligase
LATHGREAGIIWKGTRLRKIIGNGEFFNQYQRKNIEKYFGCQTADTYGSVEAVFLGAECECGSMHLSPDVGFCEIVDKSGNPVGHGKSGDLVCTGFLNYAMPLIRYRTGDCLTISQKPCSCGSSFPIVESIEGRNDDIIVCPDGRHVGRMSPTFKLNFPILEAQIEQTDLHTIIVRIVPLAKYTSADSEGIRKAVEERLGTGMEINVIAVDAIQRASAGKFKAVISRLEEQHV